jgi:hypothetical protein
LENTSSYHLVDFYGFVKGELVARSIPRFHGSIPME